LTALLESLAIRKISDPDAQVVDHQRQYSLLGTAALALVRGCGGTARSR
jgi:hypothetical protein